MAFTDVLGAAIGDVLANEFVLCQPWPALASADALFTLLFCSFLMYLLKRFLIWVSVSANATLWFDLVFPPGVVLNGLLVEFSLIVFKVLTLL
ncbi:hypothetical protein N7468_000545 [Penicillium chermesinum]|uniref:Uncharacterized protein n=1 Tax=Penicillium chermesinum TaxID=63820 RepID=A0A9W9TYY8_9EURO|nr:uncharacterized protein N7468_000545 [Penicillium chermesinum]KAJ5249094.1 hypothetical protein N7468_000545 [Penicillium chermesinum]